MLEVERCHKTNEFALPFSPGLGGGARSMAIRGPCRYEKWQAEEDADALQKASLMLTVNSHALLENQHMLCSVEETAVGIKAVKVLAAQLKQGKIKTSELR
eukprot:6031240-Amphidinium_carterae.2